MFGLNLGDRVARTRGPSVCDKRYRSSYPDFPTRRVSPEGFLILDEVLVRYVGVRSLPLREVTLADFGHYTLSPGKCWAAYSRYFGRILQHPHVLVCPIFEKYRCFLPRADYVSAAEDTRAATGGGYLLSPVGVWSGDVGPGESLHTVSPESGHCVFRLEAALLCGGCDLAVDATVRLCRRAQAYKG